MTLSVYFAGPDVFSRDARAVGAKKIQLCKALGFEGLFPLDGDASGEGAAVSIFTANRKLMNRADAGLFNLTPFRGPSADAGTVFELGYMAAQGKPIFGYTSSAVLYADRAETAMVCDGQRRDRDDYLIEDFGLTDNLMIVRAIREAGGDVAAVNTNGAPSLAAMEAFEMSLDMLDRFFRHRIASTDS